MLEEADRVANIYSFDGSELQHVDIDPTRPFTFRHPGAGLLSTARDVHTRTVGGGPMTTYSRRDCLKAAGSIAVSCSLSATLGAAPASAYAQSASSADTLAFMTALELARMLHGRRISSVELTQYFIDRIERSDTALNAIVVRDFDRALAAAARADEALARGDRLGPLHGVPMTIKVTTLRVCRRRGACRNSKTISPQRTQPSSSVSRLQARTSWGRRTCLCALRIGRATTRYTARPTILGTSKRLRGGIGWVGGRISGRSHGAGRTTGSDCRSGSGCRRSDGAERRRSRHGA